MKGLVFACVLVVGGCKGKDKPKDPPQAGTGTATPQVAEAAPPIDAPGAPADAAAAAITITKDGLSPIAGYTRTGNDEDDIAAIQAKLPGYTVSFEVMEFADEREEGYYSVKQGEEEVAMLFRVDEPPMNRENAIATRVLAPVFPTTEGAKVGDKVTALAATYPDLACEAVEDSELGLLQCRSAKAAGLVFVLDADGFKGKPGKLDVAKLGDREVFVIAAP